MSLWRQTPDLEQLNASQKNSIGDLLGIRFEAFDDESLTASMPVDSRTHQRSACCMAAPRWSSRKAWARWPATCASIPASTTASAWK